MNHHSLLHGNKFERAAAAHIDAEDFEPVPSTSYAQSAPVAGSEAPTPQHESCATRNDDAQDLQVLTHASTASFGNRALLKVVAVTVSGPAGSIDTYALLDDGSTATFIDDEISAKIGATGPVGSIHLDCVGGLSRDAGVRYVDFKIQGRHSTDTFTVRKARSINGLGAAEQSLHRDSILKFSYLADIRDEFCYGNVKPMIIIGIDNWYLSCAKTTRRGTRTQPAASLTALGWVLYGFTYSGTTPVAVVNHATIHEYAEDDSRTELERMIREQYSIDAMGITKKEAQSTDNVRAVQVLERTAHRLPSGRFEVGLLWRADNLAYPSKQSYQLAMSRFLSLEQKMIKDSSYAERYSRNIKDMLSKGYAEPCPPRDDIGAPLWYLPHFGVVNPNKPLKLRVVHDAAAKSCGISLNSLLLAGPDLLQSLFGILLRFREGKVALTADIREMFPQIKIIANDRDAQRFLWRDSPNEPIQTYRMSSMIFGAVSSPFTALYIKNKNALELQDRYPKAAQAIIFDHYMDDFIGSVDDVQEAVQLAADIFTVHKSAGFEMRGWVSNVPSALSLLPKECLLETPPPLDVELGHLATSVRTLGLIWQPARDSIGFNTGVGEKQILPDKLTKRIVLAAVMRIYDPLGILAPIVVRGRILFQNAWRKSLDWDEELPQSDCAPWRVWFQDLLAVSKLRIPRRYNLSGLDVVGCELHVFSDSSESAFAAVAYWRFIYVNGDVRLALICSKVRVAPLKPVSIPRLELQGALMAARLATSICEAHRLKPCKRVFWCDSMTVLGWLRSDARTFKPFVSHRVGEILEVSNVNEWRWVPGNLNVADDATRDKRYILTHESRWISGPEFLLSSDWPIESPVDVSGLGLEEVKSSFHHQVHLINESELPEPVSANPARFSSWLRMVRATAQAHRFLSLLRARSLRRHEIDFFRNRFGPSLCTLEFTCAFSPYSNISISTITASDIVLAEIHILRRSQLDSFLEDIMRIKNQVQLPPTSRLFQLSPFIDENHLLRMGGRIVNALDVSDAMKRPVILDGKHPAVRLLILRCHRKVAHQYTEMVVNELRQEFWIIGLRNAVRSVASQCELCKLRRAKVFKPPMGDLPEARLAHNQRPFTFVGLDYFGPLQLSVGRRREKIYIALYTCLAIRAVHLEMVHSLSADSAVMSLRRFIARRGTPAEVWSDNGTAFVGANRELRELYGAALPEFAANEKINWRFIPPSAPFMGGAWERLVRSVKTALRVTLRERAPCIEVLGTVLAEAEAIVNSRPLTYVSLDAGSEEALTPAHFLIGTASGKSLPATLTDADLVSRSKWRRAVRLADHFWQRWVKEYLPTLSPRQGGGAAPLVAIGDLVIIGDGELPRGSWPRGRVVALFPGRDGIARVADVATAAGTLRRPMKKLIKI